MKNRRVIIIAMDQPLDSDDHLRRKMANVEKGLKGNLQGSPVWICRLSRER